MDVVGEVAGDLLHPGAVGLADDACDLDAPRLDVDDEANEVADQATEREHLDGEEVRRRDRAQMGLQEGGPWHPTAAQGRGFETVLAEDALDRVVGEDVSKVAQDITDPRVAPGRVLGGEPDDELPKRRRRTRATSSAASSTVVLGGDELTAPAQDRVGRHEPGELVQHAAAQHSALHREAAALVVDEPQLPATELLAEDEVLLLQVVDHRELPPVDPPGKRHQQELQRRGAHGELPYRAGSRGQSGPSPAALHVQGLKIMTVRADRVLAPDDIGIGCHPPSSATSKITFRRAKICPITHTARALVGKTPTTHTTPGERRSRTPRSSFGDDQSAAADALAVGLHRDAVARHRVDRAAHLSECLRCRQDTSGPAYPVCPGYLVRRAARVLRGSKEGLPRPRLRGIRHYNWRYGLDPMGWDMALHVLALQYHHDRCGPRFSGGTHRDLRGDGHRDLGYRRLDNCCGSIADEVSPS